MNALESLPYFIPDLILLVSAFTLLLLDFSVSRKKPLTILGLVAVGISLLFCRYPTEPLPLFFGFYVLDPFSFFFKIAALGIVGLTFLISLDYDIPYIAEFVSLFLFMAFGLSMMGAANNLLMIFLSIEFVSILSYLLVGFLKKDPRSKEASLKYLLFGSVASAVMLFGMSILYGLTGSIDLNDIRSQLTTGTVSKELTLLALLLMTVGLGFKISMAPFHVWAPDVYEGAPTPVTAFLTVGPKALGFAVFVRVLHTSFLELQNEWGYLLATLSMITMTLGNVIAISQTNVKRLLGYSSIAQAGYILMGLSVSNATGVTAVLVYLVAYAFTNLGAFFCVIVVSNHFGSDEIENYAGLAQKSPWIAASLTLFLLSLAGIPPLAGFIGKFYVFASAIEGRFLMLAVVAAINSAVAAFYYFKIVRLMYLIPAKNPQSVSASISLLLGLAITLAGTILMGVFPFPFIAFAQKALIL